MVTRQAPVTLELRNAPGKKHKQTKCSTRIQVYHSWRNPCLHQKNMKKVKSGVSLRCVPGPCWCIRLTFLAYVVLLRGRIRTRIIDLLIVGTRLTCCNTADACGHELLWEHNNNNNPLSVRRPRWPLAPLQDHNRQSNSIIRRCVWYPF